MSVSTLANTKWIIKVTPTLTGQNSYNINFNSDNFASILFQIDNGSLMYMNNESEDVYAYNNNSWINGQAYRIIEITGGNDVTNATLIAWLEANATQVEVTNLANTKWVFKTTIDCSTIQSSGYGIEYKTSGSLSEENFEGINIYYNTFFLIFQ